MSKTIDSDKSAREYLDAVINQTASIGRCRVEKDCQYLDKNGKCRATTQKTCIRCRFYNPTIPAKIRKLAEYGVSRDEENERLRKIIAEKESYITELENLKDKVDRLGDILRKGKRNGDFAMLPSESQANAAELMSSAIELIEDITDEDWEFSYITF